MEPVKTCFSTQKDKPCNPLGGRCIFCNGKAPCLECYHLYCFCHCDNRPDMNVEVSECDKCYKVFKQALKYK